MLLMFLDSLLNALKIEIRLSFYVFSVQKIKEENKDSIKDGIKDVIDDAVKDAICCVHSLNIT